jgi:sigma-B regulation protein RsbU (phosphoserine phosphatase)
MEDTPYLTQEIVIEPQTTVLLYTDGLDEATDADEKLFGNDRIIDELNRAIQDGQLSPKAVIDRMTQAVDAFVGDAEQSDDLTMLCLRFLMK